jgi:hypothetical protein
MNHPVDDRDIDAVEEPLMALRDDVLARIQALDAIVGRRPTAKEREEHQSLENTLRQIEEGTEPGEQVDADLDEILMRAKMRAFRFRAPGLAPLRRLRESRQAERAALASRQQPWPRPFRYVGPIGKHQQNGAFVQPGDIVELNESQASAFADRFERLGADVPESQSGEVVESEAAESEISR